MDEVNARLTELEQRADDNDDTVQALSDTTDGSIQDIQDSISDQSDSIDDLQQNAGQLEFPLTQDTIDLINELFPRGNFTLNSGTFTLIDDRISTSSTFLYSLISPSGTVGVITITKAPGQITISSSSGSDGSNFDYVLYP